MNWDCSQLERVLDDYLEGRLAGAELAAAEAHAHACPRCAEWADARRATLWLHQVEDLQTPPGLETRILAQTLAPLPEETLWALFDRGWRLLLQPRFALGLAVSVISLSLILNSFGVSLRDVRAADFNPVNIYLTLDRQAHLTYARGVRFVNDLRLVYEIRSRLEELRPAPEPETTAPPAETPGQPAPQKGKKPQNSSDQMRGQGLFASQLFGATGELR